MTQQPRWSAHAGTFGTLVACAAVSSIFGFIGGLMGSDAQFRSQLLYAVAPGVARSFAERPAQDAVRSGDGSAVPVATPQRSDEERIVAAVEKASPAVVSIVVTKDMPVYERYYERTPQDDFFSQFFGQGFSFGQPQIRQKGTENREIGAGTGFLVSADGYIVTNKHVVEDEAAEYTVVLKDGDKLSAKVLARDPANDIAVLKVERQEGEDFPFIVMGDAAGLKVGQRTIAIGYALGRFASSVSTGIVSGLGRNIEAGGTMTGAERLFGVIQTDAAINPGNSGGPLLNLDGEAIGVNVAIVQGSQNIGFALPIDDIRSVVDSVKKDGKISRAYLGVRFAMVDGVMQKKNQLPVDHGAIVLRGEAKDELAVAPGSPADVAGIVENDIILEVDGVKLTVDAPLHVAMSKKRPGDKVTLKVLHKGEKKDVVVTLAERK